MEKKLYCLNCAQELYSEAPHTASRYGGRGKPMLPEARAVLLELQPNTAMVFNPCPGPHRKGHCRTAISIQRIHQGHSGPLVKQLLQGRRFHVWHSEGALVVACVKEA